MLTSKICQKIEDWLWMFSSIPNDWKLNAGFCFDVLAFDLAGEFLINIGLEIV